MDSTTSNIQSRESSTAFDAPTYEISYGADHTLQWDPPQGSKELAIALSYHFPLERDLKSKMRAATKKFLKAETKKKKVLPGWNADVSKAKDVLVRTGRIRSLEKVNIPAIASTSNSPTGVLTSVREIQQAGQKDPILATRPMPGEPSSAPATHDNDQPLFPDFSSGIRPVKTSDSIFQSRPSSSGTLQILKWDPDMNRFVKRRKRRYGKEEGSKVAANRGNACADHQRKKMKCDPELCPQNKQNLRNGCSPRQDTTAQASKLENGGRLQEENTIGRSFPSSSSSMPEEKMTKSLGVENVPNTASDLGMFTAHQLTNSRDFEELGIENIISLQATMIPDHPSLPELRTDSWDYDPIFSSLPLSQQQDALNQFGGTNNSTTQGFRPPPSEFGSTLEYSSFNYENNSISSKPNLGDNRPLSKAEVDQQDNSQLRDTLQLGLFELESSFHLSPNDEDPIPKGLGYYGMLGDLQASSNHRFPISGPSPLQHRLGSNFAEKEAGLPNQTQTFDCTTYADSFDFCAERRDENVTLFIDDDAPIDSLSIKTGLDTTSPEPTATTSKLSSANLAVQDRAWRLKILRETRNRRDSGPEERYRSLSRHRRSLSRRLRSPSKHDRSRCRLPSDHVEFSRKERRGRLVESANEQLEDDREYCRSRSWSLPSSASSSASRGSKEDIDQLICAVQVIRM